ncbi:ATP phosphoribosyltransferase, chloroplastic [Porphyridium purpureum]|uniref:ATP phosphoribosyltransferase n=1 Tax=Porphyridium purpureum TaxID=35688 RepID=A0A5J4YQG6_PORPP|nr:ATP phosphoribosyltransferase, chloroplastic [Porphyridium purpureum]|eukprot:POR9267..scf222_8
MAAFVTPVWASSASVGTTPRTLGASGSCVLRPRLRSAGRCRSRAGVSRLRGERMRSAMESDTVVDKADAHSLGTGAPASPSAPATVAESAALGAAESKNGSVREGRKEGIMRLAIPSKGGMADETKALLKAVGMDLVISNPRQYIAKLRDVENLEVWLQRPSDIARKVANGDVDLGITGHDLIAEYAGMSQEIVTVHEDLGFGACHLGIGVPMGWSHINTIDELFAEYANAPEPLRIATKFSNLGERFFAEKGFSNYRFVYMDGALEASTQMGTADIILDLVSSGVTLRENLLKEISGGMVLQSTMQLVANRTELQKSKPLLGVARELLERIEAHILGADQYNLIANIRGASPGEVARKLAKGTVLRGMDGPTISMVIPPQGMDEGMYAIALVIPKRLLYRAVQELRSIGGSGVCVLPVTYVFEAESKRWNQVERALEL